jgi:cytochrome P450
MDLTDGRQGERAYDPIDLSSKAFWSMTSGDRERSFAALRAERPLSWHPPVEDSLLPDPADPGFWAVVRHSDVIEISRNHQTFVSGQGVLFENVPVELLEASQSFLAMDAPRHTKVRRLVSAAFTPRQVARIENQIAANAKDVVNTLADTDHAEFVNECAAELPMRTICDMIGIPAEHRKPVVDAVTITTGWNDPDVIGDQPALDALFGAQAALHTIATEVAMARRDQPEGDLMTALVQAEIEGEKLTDAEIGAFFVLLSVAGNDTTRQTTAHGMKAIAEHPEQLEWLVGDLDARLPSAVEELVRWASPVMTFRRTAVTDVDLHGTRIRAGEKVVMFYPSANWDGEVFSQPDRLNLARDPNPHVGFGGGGVHFCLGSSIARTQLRAIFGELLSRLHDIEVGEPSYLTGNFINGVKSLPIRYRASG